MEAKLFVGNLSYATTEDDLRTLFAKAGAVKSVNLITDRFNGQPKGFAFVEMETPAEAQKAISELNGSQLRERTLTVNKARPPQERGQGGFGNRGGGRPRDKVHRRRSW